MYKVIFLAVSVAGLVGISNTARAQVPDFGEWTGSQQPVPAAKCNPHCKILEGGNVEGDFYTYTQDFPTDQYLDTKTTATNVVCLGNDCIFDDQRSLSVDNLHHKVTMKILSHSGAVTIYPVAKIAGPAPAK